MPVETLKNDKITSCLGSDGQHAPRTRKHCRPCVKHAHDTEVRARTCLHGLFSVEHSYQPGTFQCTSSCNNRLRCRWIPQRTIKLRVAWEVMDQTRPARANTADRAPNTLTTQRYVRILVCTVCFQWNIHTNPVHSSAHRVVTTHYGAGGYPQERSNYELLKK